jgi:hypothetical protein
MRLVILRRWGLTGGLNATSLEPEPIRTSGDFLQTAHPIRACDGSQAGQLAAWQLTSGDPS